MTPPRGSTTDAAQRADRIRTLRKKFQDDSLTVEEAREFLQYIREDLQRAKREGNHKAVQLIQRYRDGVESYLALREQPGAGASVTLKR